MKAIKQCLGFGRTGYYKTNWIEKSGTPRSMDNDKNQNKEALCVLSISQLLVTSRNCDRRVPLLVSNVESSTEKALWTITTTEKINQVKGFLIRSVIALDRKGMYRKTETFLRRNAYLTR